MDGYCVALGSVKVPVEVTDALKTTSRLRAVVDCGLAKSIGDTVDGRAIGVGSGYRPRRIISKNGRLWWGSYQVPSFTSLFWYLEGFYGRGEVVPPTSCENGTRAVTTKAEPLWQ